MSTDETTPESTVESTSADGANGAAPETDSAESKPRARAPRRRKSDDEQKAESGRGRTRRTSNNRSNNGRSGGGRRRQSKDQSDEDDGSNNDQQSGPPSLSIAQLKALDEQELLETALALDIERIQRFRRIDDLITEIMKKQAESKGDRFGIGLLEIIEDGFGFLRGQRYLPSSEDIYVSQSQIRRFGLRTGDIVGGVIRPPKDSEKYHSLLRVESVNNGDPEETRRRPRFDSLTPIFPHERINLETTGDTIATRIVDIVAPVGRGQRGLIVSPPKAGKTMLLKAIANGVTANYSDIHLMVCLIGERPEEVTDMQRSVDGEVVSSTFDEPVEDHTKVAEMALERAKRLVESGRDVVILLDSITRLARAYNLAVPPSGRTLSGGIDPVALYPPKRFFGAARNIEGGGSLTIVATCLVDTGSRMDDVIYEEFKGTGNMELHLDRKLAERRIYPSIDIQRSGTRREDLLLDGQELRQVYTMRRMVSMLGGTEGTELVVGRMSKTQTNEEFLATLTKDV
ncbi:MAG: transcription termination factor Rho [Thermomicrobiales bacterium]